MDMDEKDKQDEEAFNVAYCARVKQLRKQTPWTQAEMANLLGVSGVRYQKYESRSPLPPYLIRKFCELVRCGIEYLLTGTASRRPGPIRPTA
jgi:transcriptional regulator with XRE-family HTH domain